MKSMRLSLIFVFLVGAIEASAEPVKVRADDYQGFTRLIIAAPAEVGYAITQSNEVAEVLLDGHDLGFDISSVFDEASRDRITSLASGFSALRMQLGCDCTVFAALDEDGSIKIDITDPDGPNLSERNSLATQDTTRTVGPATVFPPERVETATGVPDANGNSTANRVQQTPTSLNAQSRQLQPRMVPQFILPNTTIPTPAEERDLNDARDRLVSRIGSAATRGILEPTTTPIELPIFQPEPQIDTSIFDASEVQLQEETEQSPLLESDQIRITTSGDLENSVSEAGVSTTMGLECISPRLVDINSWVETDDFSWEISRNRNMLFSALDELDTKAALNLAKAYLYFGFGAEAQNVLGMMPDQAEPQGLLIEIAQIMEHGYVKEPEILNNYLDCGSSVALWAVLAVQDLKPQSTVNVESAILAMSGLPMHLRKFLAPELSRRLLQYGDHQAAASAIRSLERAQKNLDPRGNLAKAELEMATGETEAAQDRLTDVVESNSAQSARALITYVNSYFATDAAIDDDVATLVEAYAIELRDDPLGPELRRTHVVALAKSLQFDAAFLAMERLSKDLETKERISLGSELFSLLTESAPEVEFLDQVFSFLVNPEASLDNSALVGVARRLLDAGFAEAAKSVMERGDQEFGAPDIRKLRAQMSLELGNPLEARALLFDMNDPDSILIRAKAAEMTGDLDTAFKLLESLGRSSEAERTAFLSDNWRDLLMGSSAAFASLIDLSTASFPDFSLDGPVLENSTRAIEESVAARSTIEQLLEDSDFQVAGDTDF